MLRCLVELYDTAAAVQREALLGAAFGLMKVLGEMGSALTRLPAADAPGSPHAGMSFAMMRSTEGYAPGVEALPLLVQRFIDLEANVDGLKLPAGATERTRALLAGLRRRLQGAGSRP